MVELENDAFINSVKYNTVLGEDLYYDALREEVMVYRRTPDRNYFEYEFDSTDITAHWDIVLDPNRFKYLGEL